MLASQISPQWAPPSERPKTDWGCSIISRIVVEVALRVAEQRQVDEALAAALEHHVVGDLVRVRPSRSAMAAMLFSGPGS